MAYKPLSPTHVLPGAKAKLKFNVLEKMKHVVVKHLEVATGRHDVHCVKEP
ncbi:MAG: hypothetical protein ACE5JO_07075 [Candidatus Binatia bacterium]